MSEPFERLRQIIAAANMRVVECPTPDPAGPGSAIYTRALIYAIETGPEGCAVQVAITSSQADRVIKRSYGVLRDGRRLRRKQIATSGDVHTYEFVIETPKDER